MSGPTKAELATELARERAEREALEQTVEQTISVLDDVHLRLVAVGDVMEDSLQRSERLLDATSAAVEAAERSQRPPDEGGAES